MSFYKIYIHFLSLIKIVFIIIASVHLYLKFEGKNYTEFDKKIVVWKDRFEFTFVELMALLLIVLFIPTNNKCIMIDKETKLLLYTFGVILFITAIWDFFIDENYVFRIIRKITRNKDSS